MAVRICLLGHVDPRPTQMEHTGDQYGDDHRHQEDRDDQEAEFVLRPDGEIPGSAALGLLGGLLGVDDVGVAEQVVHHRIDMR